MERIRDFHDYVLYKFTFTLHLHMLTLRHPVMALSLVQSLKTPVLGLEIWRVWIVPIWNAVWLILFGSMPCSYSFSSLTLLVVWQERHPAGKNLASTVPKGSWL